MAREIVTRRAFVSSPGLRRVGLMKRKKDAMLSRGVVPWPCPAPLSIAFHTHIHSKHTLFNLDACQSPPLRWLLIPSVVWCTLVVVVPGRGSDIGETRQPLMDQEPVIKQRTPSVVLQTHTISAETSHPIIFDDLGGEQAVPSWRLAVKTSIMSTKIRVDEHAANNNGGGSDCGTIVC